MVADLYLWKIRRALRRDSAYRSRRGTVLLLHGATGWSRTWWRVGPAVAAAGYQVLALDLHGHGSSPKPGGAVSIAEVERDVAETLDERFGTRRVDIIWGHSLGAMIALMLLGRDPELAERAVLVDPPLSPGSPADLEAVEVATLVTTLAQGDPDDGFERLAALQMPALLVLAAEDRGSPITGAVRQRLASLHSLVEVVELDSGHNPHRDAFDVYTQTVLHWLES